MDERPLPGLLEGENPARFSVQQAKIIKDAVKRILRWKKDDFPGGQPVSLSMQNVTGIARLIGVDALHVSQWILALSMFTCHAPIKMATKMFWYPLVHGPLGSSVAAEDFKQSLPKLRPLVWTAELFRNAYVACEKTDGIRFLLLCANQRLYLIGRRDEVRFGHASPLKNF